MAKQRKPKRTIKRDRDGQYRWHLYGGNGEHLATGEGHPSKAKAERAFQTTVSAMLDIAFSKWVPWPPPPRDKTE